LPSESEARQIKLPLTADVIAQLRAGDDLRLSGAIYTARDAAHQRLVSALNTGQNLPIELDGAVIYYCGPTPAPPGRPIGAAGPTTSSRMDTFAPRLYAAGVLATIGKGQRALEVREACRKHDCLYLVATGGAGALLSSFITDAEVVAYPDLGPEAIRKLTVAEFPVLVGYDVHGGSIFPGDEELD